MKIAIVSTLEESVPPKKYGGIELIVANLVNGLVDRGHEVYLLASGDSKTKAKLLPVLKNSLRKEEKIMQFQLRDQFKYITIAKVIEILEGVKVDIIHSHIGWRFAPFANRFRVPTVITLHGPLDVPSVRYLYQQFPKQAYISISKTQRKPLPHLNYVANVYNGIELSNFKFSNRSDNYLAFLARISPEKGPVQAIQVAKKLNLRLKMAAKIDIADVRFFKEKVKPFIDNRQIEYVGEIASSQKSDFLGKAMVLLAPLQWEEPFGLFMTEAMACGTPVVAFARGSVPEIIKDGKTGFIVNYSPEDIRGNWIIKKTGIAGMVEAIKRIYSMPEKEYLQMRRICRKHVEKNFTAEIMVKNYEKVYLKLLQIRRSNKPY